MREKSENYWEMINKLAEAGRDYGAKLEGVDGFPPTERDKERLREYKAKVDEVAEALRGEDSSIAGKRYSDCSIDSLRSVVYYDLYQLDRYRWHKTPISK